MKSFLFKKLFPLLLAAVALLTLPLSAFAQDKEPVRQYENGYEFTIEETENGPVLRDVSYTGNTGRFARYAGGDQRKYVYRRIPLQNGKGEPREPLFQNRGRRALQ